MSENDLAALALTAARTARTPDLISKLHYAAATLHDLADHLTKNPGDGLGLSYARIWQAVDEAQSAMLQYQNNPTGKA